MSTWLHERGRPATVLDGIEWLGHAGFRIKTSAGCVYVDPYRAPPGPTADADPDHPWSLRPLLARRRAATRGPRHTCWSRRRRSRSSCAARRSRSRPATWSTSDRSRSRRCPRTTRTSSTARAGRSTCSAARPVGYVIRDGGRRIYHSRRYRRDSRDGRGGRRRRGPAPGQRDLRDDARSRRPRPRAASTPGWRCRCIGER